MLGHSTLKEKSNWHLCFFFLLQLLIFTQRTKPFTGSTGCIPCCTFKQLIDFIVIPVFHWHTFSQVLKRWQRDSVGEHAELLLCYICITCTSVVQRWSFMLVACRSTSLVSQRSTHVLINIICGVSWFHCAARATRSLGLETTDIDVNMLDEGSVSK